MRDLLGNLRHGPAARLEGGAEKYEALLGVLGGEDVRVGELQAVGPQELRGSVVIYDSKVGQSWVLVLVRAPGWEGTANVTLVAGERTIDLHEMEFGAGGGLHVARDRVRPHPVRPRERLERGRPDRERADAVTTDHPQRVTINRFTNLGTAPNRYLYA
jgi:hypothetical protein